MFFNFKIGKADILKLFLDFHNHNQKCKNRQKQVFLLMFYHKLRAVSIFMVETICSGVSSFGRQSQQQEREAKQGQTPAGRRGQVGREEGAGLSMARGRGEGAGLEGGGGGGRWDARQGNLTGSNTTSM